jgi:hypothetical protein
VRQSDLGVHCTNKRCFIIIEGDCEFGRSGWYIFYLRAPEPKVFVGIELNFEVYAN